MNILFKLLFTRNNNLWDIYYLVFLVSILKVTSISSLLLFLFFILIGSAISVLGERKLKSINNIST